MPPIDSILAAGFWCSAGGMLYTYLGYPVAIFGLSRLLGRPSSPPGPTSLPRVALLIAAHNEAAVINDRILNALALDYPPDRLQIVVASDGSDDGTPGICERHGGRVRTLHFPARRGKAATLNDAVALLDAEILVLSDANTFMDAGALRSLARWFQDPAVGAVCGRLVLREPATGRNGDGVYWRYETFIKRCEGRLGALLGANGAIYAIRRGLFPSLPAGTIVDDFLIPLLAKLRGGCRMIYDEEAVAHEETAPDLGGEFRRRARIGAGAIQAMGLLWPLLSPRHGWTCLALWSHKVMRWLCPFLMFAALLTAAALTRRPLYAAALLAQAGFYSLCLLGAVLPPAHKACRLLRLFPMFLGMNIALLIGFLRWMRDERSGIWQRTARTQDCS